MTLLRKAAALAGVAICYVGLALMLPGFALTFVGNVLEIWGDDE